MTLRAAQPEARRRLSEAKPRMLLALLSLAMLIGCETTPKSEEMPRIPEGKQSGITPPANPNLPAAHARVFVTQLFLPLGLPSDPAWEVVNESLFPAVTRSVWNANGLRVGLISRSDLDDAIKRLPASYADQQMKLIASTHPVAVRQSPTLHTAYTVDLTIPPKAVSEDRIIGGNAQLLLSVDPGHTVYLTPHHYKRQPLIADQVETIRKQRLEPERSHRTPDILDKELDGKLYRELTLAAPLGRADILVVGLHRPWPLKPTSDDGAITLSAEDAAKIARDDAPVPTENPFDKYNLDRPPVLHQDLGSALFTGEFTSKPTQILLLITIEPLAAGPALQ